ncbi:hypothetical protein BPAE_0100g00250 [Botrytis paeoniae]|uniref:FAD linked oxidase N-terminal domain-containing protein n=1 Tax=Botrytis paeoniae TaxID=278948 RepID=A0A4Z1FS63_9HELO|nr:hypothetical protein BPAE_0100g00250 [Botrytis paeoniae]
MSKAQNMQGQGTSNPANIESALGHLLSKNASISYLSTAASRWSDFKAPMPGTVVNVATAYDVLETLPRTKWSAWMGYNISHWPKRYSDQLRGLNEVKFDHNDSTMTFGGGSIISEVMKVADANGAQIPLGNFNCVGVLGAILGGGIDHMMGLYGLSVDCLVTLDLNTAEGTLIKVDPHNEELWWALRGAGSNFCIANRGVWTGSLVFTEDRIEQIVAAINDLYLQVPMYLFLYFATSGAPDYTPTVIVSPFYAESASDGKSAFASILDIGPVVTGLQVYPYLQSNYANDALCGKGGRKPSYGAGLGQLVPETWRAIWNEYTEYVKNPAVGNSSVFVECYSFETAKKFHGSSSFYPFRLTVKYIALVNNQYTDASLDEAAEAFGTKVRDL